VDQASLTDESLAVDKYRGDSVFCSTTITRGEAFGVVYATGDSTFVARATSLGSDASVLHEPSRFSHVVNSIVTTLAFLASSFLFMVWISSLYRSNPLLAILQFTLTIAIISIPLSLQAVVMTIVAVGSANLVRKKAVVRNLSAIESLACIDVLCFDKEGILTKQNLVFSDHFCFSGFNQEDLLLTACLTIKRRYQTMDSIEKGVLKTLNNCAHAKDLLFSYKVIKLFPFDLASETRTIIVESVKNERITCVRGTALSVLKIVEEDHVVPKDIRRVYTNKIEELTARGFNTQGVVRKRDDLPWEILGIIPFSYPLRVDSHRTFHKARSLGLDIKMLTKDSVGVARATCRWLGQETNVFDVNMLLKLAGADGYDLVEAADVLARIAPEHKPIVVDFLRERGYKVAITGGNPEDANVLKKADIGIAVHGACDAARWAADVVLLAPGFPAIADAIATSRQVFQRMHSYVLYRVALCLYLEIFFSLWIVILNQSLKPEVIIFIAVLTDIATLATAYDNVPISKGPAQWNLRRIFSMAFVLGVLLTISSWVALTTMFPYRDTKRSQHMTEVDGGIVQNFAVEDAVIFLQVTLLGSWSIFIVRVNGAFWTSFPSWKLSGAVFVTNIIATLFCLFGWFVGGQTSITTIVRVWVYAFGMFCLTGTVFYLAERIAMRLFRSKDAGLIVLRGSAREESGRSKQRSLEDFGRRFPHLLNLCFN
jgi:H+-transporting ATPase